jgi:hypothetical protein
MENIGIEFDLFSFPHTANSRACQSRVRAIQVGKSKLT